MSKELPDSVRDVISKHERWAFGSIGSSPHDDEFESDLAAAIDGRRESIAADVEALAANYPEKVFPEHGVSRDSISGTAMRHAYRNAARSIREDSELRSWSL